MLAQATQPCPNLWTPNEVITLITVISTVFVGAVVGGWLKVIDAQKNAKLAIIAAAKATGKAEANSDAIIGLQHQVTSVALATSPAVVPAPAARSPVVPATFADAQLRAAANPDDCPPQDVTTTTTTTTTSPPAAANQPGEGRCA
jgi:hypothetical protein